MKSLIAPTCVLHAVRDMEEFKERHPDHWRGPCFMEPEDFQPGFLFDLKNCEALATSLRPRVCLLGLTLPGSPLPSDDAMSVASTPPRINGDRKCWQCGESTRFGFELCSDCHHSEGLKRAQSRAQIAPLEKNHVCFKCKSGPTISQFLLCDECLQKC